MSVFSYRLIVFVEGNDLKNVFSFFIFVVNILTRLLFVLFLGIGIGYVISLKNVIMKVVRLLIFRLLGFYGFLLFGIGSLLNYLLGMISF